MNKTEKIAQLNDIFRTSFIGGKVLMTIGIRHKPVDDVAQILTKVREFKDFNEGNNPYLHRDFGKFAFKDDVIIWKIDYYDKSLKYGSEDPSNTDITTRVLTIMTAEEW